MIVNFRAGLLITLMLTTGALHASMSEYFYLSKLQPAADKVELVRSFIVTTAEDSTGYSSKGGVKNNTTMRKHVTTEKLSVDPETALNLGCCCGNLEIITYSLRRLPHGRLTIFSKQELLEQFDKYAVSHPRIPTAVVATIGTAITAAIAYGETSDEIRFAYPIADRLPLMRLPWYSKILHQKKTLAWGAGITGALSGLLYWAANKDYQYMLKIRAALEQLDSDIK